MGLFNRKKEYKVGDEITPSGPSYPGSRKEELKQGIKKYARLLKSTYLTPLQRKDLKTKMAELEVKLKKAEAERKYYAKVDALRKKKETIKKLKGGNSKLKKVDNYSSYFKMPDVLGANIGQGKPTKLNLPGGPSKRTKQNGLNFGLAKVPRYY